ncbi:MAG: kynureninase [Ferruginibacter sp.]
MQHQFSLEYARSLDHKDSLQQYRERFIAPHFRNKRAVYFLGNSLGLQPIHTEEAIKKIMTAWGNLGVEGFFLGEEPWLDYPGKIAPMIAKIVGALPAEVVTMNHLTVNLHLLMISFYSPTPQRYKIICEAKAFPSDQYALQSQAKLHGFDPADAIVEVQPKKGTELITTEDILTAIEQHKDSLALVLFGGLNYYTGQVFDIRTITTAAHKAGAKAGFDLAHAAGNIKLELHNWDVDFACWCNYKYLNSGPGSIAGAFVHQKHLNNPAIKRLEGWWGNDISNRFKMGNKFTPYSTAEAWSLSTAPMLLMAAHKASLEIFEEAGFDNLVAKSKALSKYLFFCLEAIDQPAEKFAILTPANPEERGCQVSISVHKNARAIFDTLLPLGIFADWREPNVIRVAPVPLYNSFEEIFIFADILRQLLQE